MSEEFVSKFLNLRGVTIGERRKALFHLLNSYKTCADDINFAHLQPRTFLEEKFKVDILIYFKRASELIETLQNEKPYLVNRILRQKDWFFQAFCKIPADQLTSVVFPNTSFKTKVKLINKLATYLNDPDQAASYFEAIKNKYGYYLAAKLLPACHSDFILDFLSNHKKTLTGKQALTIITRYPKITEDILDIVMNSDTNENYQFLFPHIAQSNCELFFKLNEKYGIRNRLGWRLTEKFVHEHETEVISSPNDYYSVLHERTIAKALNHNFSSLFVNLFPKRVEEFEDSYSNLFSVLRRVPNRMHPVRLLVDAFQQAYGESFWNYPSFLSLELMRMLPLDQRRQRVSLENKPAFVNEEDWVCYLPTDQSLPYFKHKISLSSAMKSRAKLVECLVLTCKLNSDLAALLEVCSYMVNKHRNDNVTVREAFLRSLTENFQLETLSKPHWDLINEMVTLSYLNSESPRNGLQIKEAYIHYLLLHELPIRDRLLDWIQMNNYNLRIVRSNSRFSLDCLLEFGEIINGMEGELFETWALQFANNVIAWNKEHGHDPISIFKLERFEDLLRSKFDSDDFDYKWIQVLVYCIQFELEKREEYFDRYLSLSERYGALDLINWMMLRDVSLVQNRLEILVPIVLEDYRMERIDTFCKYSRDLSHLNVPQRIVGVCRDKFGASKDQKSVRVLSFLQDSNQFVEVVREFYPVEKEADYKTPEGRELYALLQTIGACLKHLSPPSTALESILIFCKGDYLKLVRGSLYSIADSVNENKLEPFFSELITRAVSTRKHAMHLTFRVLDKVAVYGIIKRFMEKEKNASLRKFIFKICFNFFAVNPEPFTWELVTLNLSTVDIEDREAIEVLLQIDKVPKAYLVSYISLAWTALHSRPDPDNQWEGDKATVLRSISPELIPELSKEFFDNVISLYFLKSEDLTHFTSVVNAFVCKYILYAGDGDEQMARMTSSFTIVTEYVRNGWRRTAARNTATDFLKEFCMPFLKRVYHKQEIFTAFATMWNTMLPPQQTFDEYLHLHLTHIALNPDGLALKIEKLCDTLVSSYGQIIIAMLCKKINFFSRYIFVDDEDSNRYALIESLICDGSSTSCRILAIFLLTQPDSKNRNWMQRYNLIIEKLDKCSEPVIQLYLSSHIGGKTLFYQ